MDGEWRNARGSVGRPGVGGRRWAEGLVVKIFVPGRGYVRRSRGTHPEESPVQVPLLQHHSLQHDRQRNVLLRHAHPRNIQGMLILLGRVF